MPHVVQPFPMRSTISEDSGTLQISVPMKRSWFAILFLVFWLGMWQMGWRDTAKQLSKDPAQPFLLFWIAGWTLGGIWAVAWCLRMLAGQDIVTVKEDTFDIRKQVLALGWTRQYLRPQRRDLRFRPEFRKGRGHQASCIAFDYGANDHLRRWPRRSGGQPDHRDNPTTLQNCGDSNGWVDGQVLAV